MSNLMQSVDERTQLAGTNRLEVLLFSLGFDSKSDREEIFGINVFKVKEVMNAPEITRAPDMPEGVEGMVSLRGETMPVINLQEFCGIKTDKKPAILIVTEYNKHLQGFLVYSVDSIKRLAWENVKAPPAMLANKHGGLVTAVTEIDGSGLVMIMDVEKVLAETAGLYEDDAIFEGIKLNTDLELTVLYVDDSIVARKQIQQTLDTMGISSISAINGRDAWNKLLGMAESSKELGQAVKDQLDLILTDIEMPEMDGYVLTRKIKEDINFKEIPVVMHSSLTTESNQALGTSVGADAYVAKFQPRELAKTIMRVAMELKK